MFWYYENGANDISPGEIAVDVTERALKAGYRHVRHLLVLSINDQLQVLTLRPSRSIQLRYIRMNKSVSLP